MHGLCADSQRRHCFDDLKPYQCLEEGCSDADATYARLKQLKVHYVRLHPYAPLMTTMGSCPFCAVTVTQKLRFNHVGRHMEEIAYATVNRQYQDWQFYSETASEVASLPPRERMGRQAQQEPNRSNVQKQQPDKQPSKIIAFPRQGPPIPISSKPSFSESPVQSSKPIGAWLSLSKSGEKSNSRMVGSTSRKEKKQSVRATSPAKKESPRSTVRQDPKPVTGVPLHTLSKHLGTSHTEEPANSTSRTIIGSGLPLRPAAPAAPTPESFEDPTSTVPKQYRCVLCPRVSRLSRLRQHYWTRHVPCCGVPFQRDRDDRSFAAHLYAHCSKLWGPEYSDTRHAIEVSILEGPKAQKALRDKHALDAFEKEVYTPSKGT